MKRKIPLKALPKFIWRHISILPAGLGYLRGLLRFPVTPKGPKLDMDKFELTWSDEFDGGKLDRETWSGSNTMRRDGYWQQDMAQVQDGTLHISSQYKPDGVKLRVPEEIAERVFAQTMPEGFRAYPDEGYVQCPPGYCTAGLDTSQSFRQKFGYFEARCKLPKGLGLWSAFWLMNEAVCEDGCPGRDGTEIDVYESFYWRHRLPLLKNMITTNLNYGGYWNPQYRTKNVGKFRAENPYDTFHTYGVEWNETEYIFYIDGIETRRSRAGGVCQAELYLLLSVEHVFGGIAEPPAGDIRKNKPEDMTDFVVDYVRAYQYKDRL